MIIHKRLMNSNSLEINHLRKNLGLIGQYQETF